MITGEFCLEWKALLLFFSQIPGFVLVYTAHEL